MTRLLGITALAVSLTILLVASAAQSAGTDRFSATVTPSAVQPGSSGPFTVSITNRPTSTRSANNAHVNAKGGFTVDAATLVATTSAAGSCSAATWTASLNGTTIDAVSPGGTADLCPGATLTLTFASTAPAADGIWQWTTSLNIDSTHFDLQGSQPTVAVDSKPPAPPTITAKPLDPSNNASPSFSFKDSEEDVTFQCALDGGAASVCTSPKTYTGVGEGQHTFSVTAVDAAGNQSAATSYTWTIDLTPPPQPTITSPAPDPNASSASFSFTDGEAGATFRCKLDGGAASACTSPKAYSGLADGQHTFSVTAVDAAGNQSAAASVTWTIDNASPPAPTITAKPPSASGSANASFSFTDADATATFECKLDSAAYAACGSPASYGPLAEGSHTFAVRARDAAGNLSNATSYDWTIDLTAPPAPDLSTTVSNPSNSGSASFSFTDGEAGATFRCKLDGGAASACTSPKAYSGLADGQHTFSVTAVDGVGNESGVSSYVWTIDTKPPPAPAITTSLPNVTASTSASFALSDSEAAVAFLCRLDSDAFAPCPATVTYNSLAEGSHTFQAKVSDAAHNESAVSSFTWTIDLTNPVVTITPASEPPKLTNHSSASFVFTSNKPNSTFACRLDGAAFSACSSPASYSGLASGKHAFAVKATDSFGNVGLPTIWEWTVDTVPPKTTITHAPTAVSSSPSATFEFTSSEPVAGFACSLDGAAFAACSSPKSYGGLANGQHTFRVRATDLAGNTEASPASYSWQVSTLLPPDTTPPAPVKNLKPTVAYGSLKLAWTLPTDLDLDHVQVMRMREPSGTGATRVYQGKGSGYADRHFQNGTWYRYAIRSYDHAGNASRRVTLDVRPSALLRSPADGAVVKAPPLLRWTAVAKARYYNVQLYRGKKKVLSTWPVRARLQLKRRWRYQTYPFRLRTGTYRWYVWPAFGAASKPTFGQLIGTGTFVVR
jgi:large repetitive protein